MPFCCILRSQSMEIPHPKLLQAHDWMAKKPHKKGKKVFKRLVKQRKGKVQKPGEY